MESAMLEWTKVLGAMILSWPVIIFVLVLAFRSYLRNVLSRFAFSEGSKAELGPIKIELGKLAERGQQAVDTLSKINLVMAESRVLELEITDKTFGAILGPEQRQRMNQHIELLKKLTEDREAE